MTRKDVFDSLCEHAITLTGIDIRFARRKTGDVVMIRAAIIVIMCRYYKCSLNEIGYFIRRDHTTVIYHRDNHLGRYHSDYKYADFYNKMVRHVESLRPQEHEISDVISLIKSISPKKIPCKRLIEA